MQTGVIAAILYLSFVTKIIIGFIPTNFFSRVSPKIIKHTSCGVLSDKVDISPNLNGSLFKQIIRRGDVSQGFPLIEDEVIITCSKMYNSNGILVYPKTNEDVNSTSFYIGSIRDGLPRGWDYGVRTMSIGEISVFEIKPDLAFGSRGSPGLIEPNETIVCQISLIGILPSIKRTYKSNRGNETINTDELKQRFPGLNPNKKKVFFDPTKHKIDPNTQVKGEYRDYYWFETMTTMEVEVPLPLPFDDKRYSESGKVSKSDVDVMINATYISVKLARDGTVLTQGLLHGVIDPSQSMWALIDYDPVSQCKQTHIQLSLEKSFGHRDIWATVLHKDCLPDSNKTETETAPSKTSTTSWNKRAKLSDKESIINLMDQFEEDVSPQILNNSHVSKHQRVSNKEKSEPIISSALQYIDIDIESEVNSSYGESIYDMKFKLQESLRCQHPVFGSTQTEMSKTVHNKACDFIAGAAHLEGMSKATTILAFHLFDRALYLTLCKKEQISLLACTCLFVASKVEEIYPPYADQLVIYSGKKFEKNDLIEMERELMHVLSYQVALPTRYDFAMRFAAAANLSSKERCLMLLLLELSFLDYNFNYLLASQVAAGVVHFTMQIMRPYTDQLWTPTMQYYTRCKEEEIVEVVIRLRTIYWTLDGSSSSSSSSEGCSGGAMKGIFVRYPSETNYAIDEIYALDYKQLRFDSVVLPAREVDFVLPVYDQTPIISHATASASAVKSKNGISLHHQRRYSNNRSSNSFNHSNNNVNNIHTVSSGGGGGGGDSCNSSIGTKRSLISVS